MTPSVAAEAVRDGYAFRYTPGLLVHCNVAYYNHERYHESLENVTPLDVYSGRYREVLSERKRIKRLTMQRRKREYRAAKAA